MNRVFKFLVLAAMSLIAAGSSFAQCIKLSPGYGSYRTYTITPTIDATNYTGTFSLTKTIQLEGTTTVTGTNCYAYHQPSLSGNLNGQSISVPSPQVQMTKYINLFGSITITFGQGVEFGDLTESAVFCSHLGSNIYAYRFGTYFEFAYTWAQANGVPVIEPNGHWKYPVVQFCSNGTPDFNPTYADDAIGPADNYFVLGAFMMRSSPTAYWSVTYVPAPPFTITSGPGPIMTHLCTHTGPQI